MSLMIVEDHPTEIAHCAMALARQSFRYSKIFRDGIKAQAHLDQVVRGQAAKPRAIVLDLDLPIGSGQEVLRMCRMHAELRDIPVIVWSKLEDQTQRDICIAMGASEFIPKGFGNLERLTAAVRRALTRPDHPDATGLAATP